MKLRNVALAVALVLAFFMLRPTPSQAGVRISIGPYGVHAGYGYRHYGYSRPYYPYYRKRYYGYRSYKRRRYYGRRSYRYRRYRHYRRYW